MRDRKKENEGTILRRESLLNALTGKGRKAAAILLALTVSTTSAPAAVMANDVEMTGPPGEQTAVERVVSGEDNSEEIQVEGDDEEEQNASEQKDAEIDEDQISEKTQSESDSDQQKEKTKKTVKSTASDTVSNGDLGTKLKWTLYKDGTLKVTGSGATYDFSQSPHMYDSIRDYTDKVKKLELTSGITAIGPAAFSEMSNLTGTVTIPSSVKTIGERAFESCGFSKVILPDSVERIDSLAFAYNHALTSFDVPVSLKTLDRSAFDGCEKLAAITSKPGSKYFKAIDNVLFSTDMKTLVQYPQAKTDTGYNVPSGVTKIVTMSENRSLRKITLPNGVTDISGAFCWDTRLTEINIPDSVKTIGNSTFYNCTALKNIDIPAACSLIGEDSFLFCKSLEKITIRSTSCKIKKMNAPRTTVIYGYKSSTAQAYADKYGYEFRDIRTGDVISSRKGNADQINALPKTGIEAGVPLENIMVMYSGSDGEVTGYDCSESNSFIKADQQVKNEIKAKTKELCSGKTTNYEKAEAIYSFVNEHMDYKGAPYDLNTAWRNGVGNCMTYADLTAAMLYYAGIPNGFGFSASHVINLALCDGRWIPIDSQGDFDQEADSYKDFTTVIFSVGKLIYVIDDYTGIKLAQVGIDKEKVDQEIVKNGITIPSWVKGYYTKGWVEKYPNIVIRGTKGTAAERMVKELGYNKITYSGNSFTAKKTTSKAAKKVVVGKPKVSYKGGKKKITIKYRKASNATGFQVKYKKAGAKKYKSKRFTTAKSSKKTIRKLKKGKYKIKVRAFNKNGKKYTYGKWTKVKKVRVR